MSLPPPKVEASARKWSPEDLARSVARVWRPLTPPLDETSLRILKFMLESPNPVSLYRVSKDLGISFSAAYKKGRILEQNRLIHQVSKSSYIPTIKGCIAGVSLSIIDYSGFYTCINSRWPLQVLNVTPLEAAALLYVLGVIMGKRGLDLPKATICNFEEASLHVFKVYLKSVVAQYLISGNVREALEKVASSFNAPPLVIADAFKAAVKGILEVVPPSIVTGDHRILITLHTGMPKVVAVVCRRRCRVYEEETGITCPLALREAFEVIEAAGSVKG